jgi:hypothetical protein
MRMAAVIAKNLAAGRRENHISRLENQKDRLPFSRRLRICDQGYRHEEH